MSIRPTILALIALSAFPAFLFPNPDPDRDPDPNPDRWVDSDSDGDRGEEVPGSVFLSESNPDPDRDPDPNPDRSVDSDGDGDRGEEVPGSVFLSESNPDPDRDPDRNPDRSVDGDGDRGEEVPGSVFLSESSPNPNPNPYRDPDPNPDRSVDSDRDNDRGFVDRLMAGDTDIDYTEFRRWVALQPGFDPSGANTLRLKSDADLHLRTGETREATRLAVQVLELNPAYADAHMMLARIYRDAGETEEASFHRTIATGLLESLRDAGGDGGSLETAWRVISEAELRLLLRMRGLSVVNRDAVTKDLAEAETPESALAQRIVARDRTTGEEVTVYVRPLVGAE